MNVWDSCQISDEQAVLIQQITQSCGLFDNPSENNVPRGLRVDSDDGSLDNDAMNMPINHLEGIDGLHAALIQTEHTCANFIGDLDRMLLSLQELASAHDNVTGRTNSLMMSCENLMEEQQSLQQTIEYLNEVLAPFNEIESVAILLGIPTDARGKPMMTVPSSSSTQHGSSNFELMGSHIIDPRSPEFHGVLIKLTKALASLEQHHQSGSGGSGGGGSGHVAVFKDADKYLKWLRQLQHRATSLVAKAMRELLQQASAACVEASKKLTNSASVGSGTGSTSTAGGGPQAPVLNLEDQPLESMPVYSKFRGLGFRMRELSSLLQVPKQYGYHHSIGNGETSPIGSGPGGSGGGGGVGEDDISVMSELKQHYVNTRNELLVVFMKEIGLAKLIEQPKSAASAATAPKSPTTATNGTSGTTTGSLCPGIRHAYSVLLRVAQLEQQLFDSLFRVNPPSTAQSLLSAGSGAGASPRGDSFSPRGSHAHSTDDFETSSARYSSYSSGGSVSSTEVLQIMECLCHIVGDALRPLVIHESSVDELCRIVTTLSEDVRSQILALHSVSQHSSQHSSRSSSHSHHPVTLKLVEGLDLTISDTQERLMYCAEQALRQSVQLFDARPSHLAYPDLLIKQQQGGGAPLSPTMAAASEGAGAGGSGGVGGVDDLSRTWYPPLKQSLSLLSKLFGVVERAVFEDFARRVVSSCVAALTTGADGVRRLRASNPLHADLFLVRHLLILREQLLPFEIRLQGTEKRLDFKTTGVALNRLAHNTKSLLRMDASNGILQLAWEGVPTVNETTVDAKRQLDQSLKQACLSLKQSALKQILGPLDALLAKVAAFVGDIPIHKTQSSTYMSSSTDESSGSTTTLLSPEAVKSLKAQAFLRPERVKDALESIAGSLGQAVPDLRDTMKLYVENPTARNILLKPVQQEIELTKLKMETVIAACIDDGSSKRELEQLLSSLLTTVLVELTK